MGRAGTSRRSSAAASAIVAHSSVTVPHVTGRTARSIAPAAAAATTYVVTVHLVVPSLLKLFRAVMPFVPICSPILVTLDGDAS